MNDAFARIRARGVSKARAAMVRAVRSYPVARRAAERAVSELEKLLVPGDMYETGYFQPKGGSLDGKASGYLNYKRESSNLDVAAYVIFKHFRPDLVLDVGSARGFLLEALSDVGTAGFGIDISRHAVHSAAPEVRRSLVVGAATHLPFRPGSFPVVSAFETLEHLPPRLVPAALSDIRRVCGGYLIATIPSFGVNEHGPDGWFAGKVRWDLTDYYEGLGPAFEGPVPFPDLMRDPSGYPIEGHLTIASFTWWTKRFEEAGLVRCGELEEKINPDLGRFGLLGDQIWHLYVLRRAEADPATLAPPSQDEIAQAEKSLGLDQRP